ncbi:CRISPR-associated protein Csx3 [Candidatus Poribacteria bacterium]|nr:CRISPR-associated protein Csx3 [Candidatus Poribacteria bacterium]
MITRDYSILRVGFGTPSDNTQMVKDAAARLDAMQNAGELSGGGLLKINGPASLPVAMFLGHRLSQLYEAIACFDPKMNKYVIAISRSSNPSYAVGNVID